MEVEISETNWIGIDVVCEHRDNSLDYFIVISDIAERYIGNRFPNLTEIINFSKGCGIELIK